MSERAFFTRSESALPPDEGVHGFGVAWDPAWVSPDRLIVRGWRAHNGHAVIARWDVEALIATVEDALDRARWPELDRRAARAALHELYAPDLSP